MQWAGRAAFDGGASLEALKCSVRTRHDCGHADYRLRHLGFDDLCKSSDPGGLTDGHFWYGVGRDVWCDCVVESIFGFVEIEIRGRALRARNC